MTFDEAFDVLLGFEGGYSNDPADPGGETMWGVTFRVARASGYYGPMKDMPRDVAKAIYFTRYWLPTRCNDLPGVLRYPMFDSAVNSGVHAAIVWLQTAVSVEPDGAFGPATLHAVEQAEYVGLACEFLAERLLFLTESPNWGKYGRGWTRRVAVVLKHLKLEK